MNQPASEGGSVRESVESAIESIRMGHSRFEVMSIRKLEASLTQLDQMESDHEASLAAIKNADMTLDWLLTRFLQSLKNMPIRDGDECVTRAERTQKNLKAILGESDNG